MITGWTDSDDFPTVNAFQSSKAGPASANAFVAKLNSAGNQILFSTYLGGSFDERLGFNLFSEDPYGGVAVDPGGNIYVTGVTRSDDFPTKNAFQSAKLGTVSTYDIFLSKFDPNGGLVYSTYLGGTDIDLPRDIAVDAGGNAYIAGGTSSTDFPLVSPLRNQSSGGDPGFFPRTQTSEGFLTRFNAAGNQLLYSTYIGGLGDDQVGGLALGDAGIVYLVGDTNSDDIPIALPPEPLDAQPADLRLQQGPVLELRLLTATRNGGLDLFITVLDPSDNSVSLSGYLGGSADELSGRIALDDTGYVHVTGMTRSSDYPVYNPIQGLLPGQWLGGAPHSGIVSALDPETANAHYSTYLGSGVSGDYANDLATTNSSVLVTGRATGGLTGFRSSLPLANPFARGRFGDLDAYATKLMFSRGQFLSPFAGQDWSRFVRVDTHANGVPDPLDEVLSVYRNGSGISFSSARWSESLLQLSNTNPGNGEFETATRTKAIRNRFGTPRGTLTTTASITGRDSGRITSISLDQERVTSTTTNKNGQVTLIDSNEDGIYDAIRGQGDGFPEVTVSLVLIDFDSDGTADFVTIPWVLAHLVGVNRADFLPDPQVFVPLGDTDGDTIPDTVAFDFDVDNVADADLPSLTRMAGPGSDPEYKLHFAHFGDGAGLVFSQIILFTLDPLSEANVTITIRDDDGQLLSIDLNGTVVNGQLQAVIPACGIRSFKTDSQGPVQGGSVTVSSDEPVAGVLLFGGSIGLAGVGSSQEMGSGFLAPMETNTAAEISTGLAVKNLELSALTFTFRLLNSDGLELASTQRVVAALGHLSLFLDQLFQTVDLTDFLGVLRVEAEGRMTATVLQIRPGEFATMPVTPLGGGAADLQFAHFGEGLGLLFSQFLIVNAHDKDAESLISMQADDGSPLTYDLNGEVINGTTSPFAVPSQGIRVFKTDGEGDLISGSGTVTPNFHARRLAGVILFGGSVGLAGVGSSPVFPQGFIAPIEAELSKGINTGIAVRNTSFVILKLVFRLFDAEGKLLATDTRSMLSLAHEALFVNQFDWVAEPGVTLDFEGFQGVIKVTPDGDLGIGVTATVVQTRPGQFATMPVSPLLH